MKELSCDQAVAHATALDQAAQAMVKLKEVNAARQEEFNRECEANYVRHKSEIDTLAYYMRNMGIEHAEETAAMQKNVEESNANCELRRVPQADEGPGGEYQANIKLLDEAIEEDREAAKKGRGLRPRGRERQRVLALAQAEAARY